MAEELMEEIQAEEVEACEINNEGDAAGEETSASSSEFAAVKARLEEIATLVSNEDAEIDSLLDLYEEAVNLGLKASDLLEVGITAEEEAAVAEAGEGGEPTDEAAAAAADEDSNDEDADQSADAE